MIEESRPKRREPFFSRYPELELSLADVVTPGNKGASERAPYAGYLKDLRPMLFDQAGADFRAAALRGELRESDFFDLNRLLVRAKSERDDAGDLFRHYAALKMLAMQIAQVVFVHRCLIEGLPAKIRGYRGLSEDLAGEILQFNLAAGRGFTREAVEFYASLFLLQTAFDRIFVPPEPIGRYCFETGEYFLSSGYREATRYLDLCAIYEVEAKPAERVLCENITTGWGDGIERPEWDRLNALYYQGRSPHSGRPNLFAAHYNDLLERMLPQFAYSKVRLAETVVSDLKAGPRVRLLEFGAGSGAFAIDLMMALKRAGLPQDEVEYLGLEPSKSMIAGFSDNLRAKLGKSDLGDAAESDRFKLQQGSLEEAQERISELSAQPPRKTVGVFSYAPHHIHHRSLRAFLVSPEVRKHLSRIYFLEGTERHGWTKMLYMWTDCESPENFRNVAESGDWHSRLLWEEPSEPVSEYPHVTNAWCRARVLT
ncbi:MAG TPA: hypothetical protein VLV83_17175 [Acidobacteriota bacterium]|nr:hypothetical protein [Acidobacteriota bacterium]